MRRERTPILYLAPWVDIGGSDKATIDWFRRLDRERFAPALITTQPSRNLRLAEVLPYATEVWALPNLMAADQFPRFIFEFIASREIELVHIMNSRLAFDLLPDLAAMQPRPATVVQLHVEEEDRSGYVRYVTTRYDNLVDAYSVTSHHLSAAMEDYHVPAVKRRVMHTGVDADIEFNRDFVAPVRLAEGRFHVAFVARLVAQKDPMLMLDVAAAVVAEHPHALFHVIGDGSLEPLLRTRAAELGLREHVCFHGPQTDPRPWYAAADALLMTSTFEGIPFTLFEAMAMRVPVVAPALPGVCELVGDTSGGLIEPRDDVAGYARALGALADDEQRRHAIADAAREHVRAHFGVDRMADAHAVLYEELLDARSARDCTRRAPANGASGGGELRAAPPPTERIALLNRPGTGQPLVSIVVACFNHGHFLPDCLQAIRDQDYPALEVVVVDDASTDPDTRAVIAAIEAEGWAQVIRQPINRGPSAARNAALDVVRGRYVLPVDADNLLMPDATKLLVAQLQGAGETVGFIYPNLQFFGNRNDYFEAPDYNLHALLHENYCDTCSLFDRDVFDAGIRFAEDIELGHEDWDLMLQLADRGVCGERARGKTLFYRKHGFTRSDFVAYAQPAFHEDIVLRYPALYSDTRIKARDAPGLSIVVLDKLDGGAPLATLAERLRLQSLVDLELILSFDGSWPQPDEVRSIRRIPPGEATCASTMLALGLQLARSSCVLLITHGLAELLDDRALLEKIARMSIAMAALDAIAFVAAGAGENPLAPVDAPDELVTEPHAALLLRADEDEWSTGTEVAPGAEIGALLAPLTATRDAVHWCHLPSAARTCELGAATQWVNYARRAPARAGDRCVRDRLRDERVCLPGANVASPRRWNDNIAWTPPETIPLVRHANPDTGRRVVSNCSVAPRGYLIERDLGVVQRASPPGTARLECGAGESYYTVDRVTPRDLDPAVVTLGHVELAPLPLLVALLHATHRPTGRQVLLSGEDDPLIGECDVLGAIGYIEGFPIHPREPQSSQNSDYGLHGLLRAIDSKRRRHVYAVDAIPAGCEHVGELGALLGTPEDNAIALWLGPDGLAYTDDYRPAWPTPAPANLARWALAPAGWLDFGQPRARAQAVARRLLDLPELMVRGRNGASHGALRPAGYLFTEGCAGRLPLWAGVNPVTGDQLLTRHRFEANDMGYTDITLLGFMRERAPVTGTLEIRRTTIPWASRFGQQVRSV